MYRSSQSLNQVAAALARAQAELENPEKSLTATLPGPLPNGETAGQIAAQALANHRSQAFGNFRNAPALTE